MARSTVTKRRYVGPVVDIETVLDGRVVMLSHGDTVEVSPLTAEVLDQSPDNWAPVNEAATSGGNK